MIISLKYIKELILRKKKKAVSPLTVITLHGAEMKVYRYPAKQIKYSLYENCKHYVFDRGIEAVAVFLAHFAIFLDLVVLK